MIRDYATITLGVLTLLATSAAVYGILTINTQIQAKPEQVKIPDYTAELDSLKSQVDSINSQVATMSTSLTTLDTLKSDVADINGKLSDLQAKADTLQQPVQAPAPVTPLTIVLDKSNYLQTDTISITAIGANPQKTVDIELLDSTGFVVLHKTTWSDSSGKVLYSMQLSSALPVGNYKVEVISDQQTSTDPLTIIPSSTTTTTGTGSFTVQTDKTVYNDGDFIQVLGSGQVGSSITGVLTSPTGKTYSTATTIQSDGSFVMFFSPSQPYEIGTWSILVTNLGQTKSLTIYVGTNSSGSYTFTAQTDKSVYTKGDLIKVSGTGQPNTSVSAVFTSPSGLTHTTSTTTNSDGTYTLFFSIIQSYETGNWVVSVANLSQSKTVTIYIQS
ncbi:MAG TPA: hypothetical protein VFX64_02170 [Candidatus Nitrosotalea sp.]|nr:hypothetical protein [Candidatus Nitrosotalea sp.]